MARSFAVAQNYRKSAGQYDQLIRLDPDQLAPRVERARVLYSDNQFSAARTQYESILSHTPDEAIMASMTQAIQQNPKVKAVLDPYVLAAPGGAALRQEVARLSTTVPDPDVRIALHRLACDYDARAAENNAVKLEMDAQEQRFVRPYTAMEMLRGSAQFEPTNTQSLFGYGQELGNRRWTNRELEAYSQVLDVDPTNRDAMVASERANAEIGPKLDGSVGYFSQRGRNGLAQIDRTRFTMAGSMPLGDENEYLQLGYSRTILKPTDDTATLGSIPFLRFQKRFWGDQMLGYGQLNIENYSKDIPTRPTFDVGAYYYWNDWITLQYGGYLENVLENGESIRQAIYRGGVYGGANVRPTRQWDFGGLYRYARYSDNNDMNYFNLYNNLALTLPPKMLRLVENVYFWGYRSGTIFPTNPPNPNDLFGAIHPYFAPKAFTQAEIRLEWWHWLSRDYFVHSNQCYYSLQYGLMTDNYLETYHNLRAILNYDVCTWLTVGAEAQAQLSTVYHMYSAMAFFQIRFR